MSTLFFLLAVCHFGLLNAVDQLEVRIFRSYTTGLLMGPIETDCIPNSDYYRQLPYFGSRWWDWEGHWCWSWLLYARPRAVATERREMIHEHSYCRIFKQITINEPFCYTNFYDTRTNVEDYGSKTCFPTCEDIDQICEGAAGVNELRRPLQAQSVTGRLFNSFRQQASPADPFPLRGTDKTHDRAFPNRTVFGRQCAPWVAVLAKWEEDGYRPSKSPTMNRRIDFDTPKPFSHCVHVDEMHPFDPVLNQSNTKWPFSTFCYLLDRNDRQIHVEHCLQDCSDTKLEITGCVESTDIARFKDRGAYTGTRTQTVSGQDCLQWNIVQFENQRNITEYGSINSCQCPHNVAVGSCDYGPWCYVEVEASLNGSAVVKWEPCFPSCSSIRIENAGCVSDLTEVEGSLTKRFFDLHGRHCLLWETVDQSKFNQNWPKDMENSNFCRMGYTSAKVPSCFVATSDTTVEESPCYEECQLSDVLQNDLGCINETNRYTAQTRRRLTVDNLLCVRWEYQLAQFRDLDNFCANPDDSDEGPWCFALDRHTQAIIRQSCYPPCQDYDAQADEPLCQAPLQLMNDYVGLKDTNAWGVPCVPWDNVKEWQLENYTLASQVSGSFCRNPNSDSIGPWCYVRRFGEDVPSRCFFTCRDKMLKCTEEKSRALTKYEGNRQKTVFGLDCEEWTGSNMRFNRDNFCQNYDFNPMGPWCYTLVGRFKKVPQPCFKFCDDYDEDKDDEDRRLYHAEKKERKLSSVVPSGPTKHGVYELTRGQEEKPHHLNRNTRQLNIRSYGRKDKFTVACERFAYGVLSPGLVAMDLFLLVSWYNKERFWGYYNQVTGKLSRCWGRFTGEEVEEPDEDENEEE